jgi:hypothetical protein
MTSGNAGHRHIRGRSERPHNGWRPPHCASSAAWTIPPHPAHCSARSSGTSAQNRSERTVGSYLESARLADAFLEGRGKRLEQATQADLEDFVAHILRRRSASTNALACRRGSTRANRPATGPATRPAPPANRQAISRAAPAAPRASPGSRCASPIPVAWSGGWRRLAGLSRGRDGPPLVHSSPRCLLRSRRRCLQPPAWGERSRIAVSGLACRACGRPPAGRTG